MKAAKFEQAYDIDIVEKEMPEVRSADDVLLKMLRVGICGSDTLLYKGLHKYVKFPIVPGHECVARVEQVGTNVKELHVGDLVTVQPQLVCGKCYACRHGRINVCREKVFLGINTDGFFTEYCCVPAFNVVKLPVGFPVEKAMLVEPFAVGANAAERADAAPDTKIVVVGAGTIGNCTAQVATAMGAEVLILDIQEEKLEYAKSCGIAHAASIRDRELYDAIKEAFPDGADVIIDCCAVNGMFEKILLAAENGSRIVLVGTYEKNIDLDGTILQRREIDIVSVMQYVRRHYLRVIEMLFDGRLHTEGFVGKWQALSDIKQAFDEIVTGKNTSLKTGIIVAEQ